MARSHFIHSQENIVKSPYTRIRLGHSVGILWGTSSTGKISLKAAKLGIILDGIRGFLLIDGLVRGSDLLSVHKDSRLLGFGSEIAAEGTDEQHRQDENHTHKDTNSASYDSQYRLVNVDQDNARRRNAPRTKATMRPSHGPSDISARCARCKNGPLKRSS